MEKFLIGALFPFFVILGICAFAVCLAVIFAPIFLAAYFEAKDPRPWAIFSIFWFSLLSGLLFKWLT